MIFNFNFLVSHISNFITLMPGDLITTGTPPGVGLGMSPPKFLKAGDVIFSGTPAGVGKLKKDDSVLATLHQPNASALSFKIS